MRNVASRFYDFTARHFAGTHTETLTEPPIPACPVGCRMGGAACCLARFDPAADPFARSAKMLDGIRGRQEGPTAPDARPSP